MNRVIRNRLSSFRVSAIILLIGLTPPACVMTPTKVSGDEPPKVADGAQPQDTQPSDQAVLNGKIVDAAFKLIVGKSLSEILGEAIGDAIGESIERTLRDKLHFESDMDWKLLAALDDFSVEGANENKHNVTLIHLMLPADQPKPSETIILNSSDEPAPFLRLTRSYGLVSRPTASVVVVAQTDKPKLVADETLLVWKDNAWHKVAGKETKETIE